MPDIKQFKLPDVGEGLTEADILTWRVAVGDTVEVNQIIVEVETAKAAVELPSPYAGLVTALHCSNGDTVDVGKPIISIDTAPGAELSGVDAAGAATGAHAAPEGRQPVLVGYGPRAEGATGRRRRGAAVTPSAQTAFTVSPVAAPGSPVPAPVSPVAAPGSPVPAPGSPVAAPGSPVAAPDARPRREHRVLATPPVRKLAKTLGLDLAGVPATGPNGTVSREDIEQAAAAPDRSAAGPAPRGVSGAGDPSGPPETRIPIKGVRKHTAAAMVSSAFTAPHVTEFVTADVTATMQLRDRVAARREFRDVKVSPLLFVARAVVLAALRTPEINSAWDDAAGEIVFRHYVNLGIAAATERGLIVPNIKQAQRQSLLELARSIGELTDVARAGRTTPAAMSGGTITITNVGVFGIDTGTPILNPGEAGIVCFGAIRRLPWVVGAGPDERIEPRWVTQLSVSFDHRLVDGQQGAQFLSDVAGVLTDPGLALL